MGRRTRAAIEAAAAEANSAAAQQTQVVEPQAAVEAPTEKRDVEVVPRVDLEKLRNKRPHVQAWEELEKKDLERRGLVQPEEEAPKEEPEAEEAKPEEQPAEAATAATEAPKTIRVKVDGEEYDAAVDEVEAYGGVKNYQITKANENRLKKTNSTLEETRKLQAQVADTLQKYFQSPKKQDQQDAEQELLQLLASNTDTERFGTPEESARAKLTVAKELIKRLSPQIDPADIINKAKMEIRHEDAVNRFKQEFSDIVSNPILLEAVLSIRQKHAAQLQGPVVDFDNFYRTIGNHVRSAVPLRQSQSQAATATTAGTTSQPSEKEARKASTASITNLPQSSARAEGPKEEKPLSYEDTRRLAINDMRKSRGQAVG